MGSHRGAFCTPNAEGFTPDLIQAHAWYNLARADGLKISFRSDLDDGEESGGLERVTKQLTPAQLAEAQRLAREWLAQHQK